MTDPSWLEVTRGHRPLLLSIPHTGLEIPAAFEGSFASSWLARKDADWWIERLYDFAAGLGATVIRSAICRSVIDVNRDPSGASLYPGQATTALCPTTTFDGEPLYRAGHEPDARGIAARRAAFFDPYHSGLRAEVARLRGRHPCVVVYDCHSIRSIVPRLFEGALPHFNIGTNGGASCAATLTSAVEAVCGRTDLSRVTDGRFKGGYITRSIGAPEQGVHAIQMELACRGYLAERPGSVVEGQWPPAYDAAFAAPMRDALGQILEACLGFAARHPGVS